LNGFGWTQNALRFHWEYRDRTPVVTGSIGSAVRDKYVASVASQGQ